MRVLVRSITVAAGIVMLATVQNASAQISETVEFTTAFPFMVGNATVPAGTYTVRPDDDDPQILSLVGARTGVLFETDPTEARQVADKTEVVFKRYGDQYVLKDIWVEGSASGAEAKTAENERHAAKNPGTVSQQRVSARKTSASAKNR